MKLTRIILIHLCILAVAAVLVTPLVWMVVAAFKSQADFYKYDFLLPPDRWSLANFESLFTQISYLRFMLNSFFVTCATVMIQLFFCALGGFALAKYQFRGKGLVMMVMLCTMIVPGEVLLAPLYELIYRMHMVDSYAGLIVPSAVSVFGMFLFRQSMLQVPDELLQAARIDGCSEVGLFWRIAMPVSRPMIGAFCLIAFMGTWNSFLWPLIILHSQELYTLPLGINQMVGVYKEDYGALMAGTLLSVLPVVVLFFALQREFIAGLTAGAVKG